MSLENSLQYKPLTKEELGDLNLTKGEYRKVQNIVRKYLNLDKKLSRIKSNSKRKEILELNPGIYEDCLYEGINFPKEYLQREIAIAEEKKKVMDLEREVVNNDLNVIKTKGLQVLKAVNYSTLSGFFIPTAFQNARNSEVLEKKPLKVLFPSLGSYLTFVVGTMVLDDILPESIPVVLGTLLITNVASGIYEYKKHVEKRTKEKLIEQDS